jgi:hypothetical protein
MKQTNKASTEGAYAEALEAAAQRIQLASRDTSMSGSSGYQSDTEKSSGQESSGLSSQGEVVSARGGDTESSSLTDDPTSRFSRSSSNSLPSTTSSSSNGMSNNSSYSSENDSFGSDDDLDSEISFLEKKQAILERASEALKRDEAFMALKAHDIVNGRYLLFGSSLWSEARTILDVLKKEGGGLLSESPTFSEEPDDTLSPLGSSIAFIQPPPPKRPKIDLSMVKLISSSDFGGPSSYSGGSAQQNRQGGNDPVACISPRVHTSLVPDPTNTNTIYISSSGHWMAQTMIYQISALATVPDRTATATTTTTSTPPPSSTNTNASTTRNSSSLDVVVDPTLGPIVLSPSHLPFHNAIQLTTALGLTSSAQ